MQRMALGKQKAKAGHGAPPTSRCLPPQANVVVFRKVCLGQRATLGQPLALTRTSHRTLEY